MQIELAYSPCPNDTYMFHALVHGLLDSAPFCVTTALADVETLNALAFSGRYGVSKLSAHAFLHLGDRYDLCASGAALGRGCGPLLVARSTQIDLYRSRVAVPGRYTTAALLLKLWNSEIPNVDSLRYDEIMPKIASGEYDAGVIIHEGRFVYPQYGCVKLVDLGQWWEKSTGLPIPLGCIGIRKDLRVHRNRIEALIRESICFANRHRAASREYVSHHALELEPDVIASHIALYVNDFSLDLGEVGRESMETLERFAREKELL